MPKAVVPMGTGAKGAFPGVLIARHTRNSIGLGSDLEWDVRVTVARNARGGYGKGGQKRSLGRRGGAGGIKP
jgi:hypothetical protein